MALLDRVKRRVETDLLDEELEALIADARDEIAARYGPDRSTADPLVPIVVELRGGGTTLDLARPLDGGEAYEIVEYDGLTADADDTTLVASDYRVLNGGRTIERVNGGTNAASRWGPRVTVEYVPSDDQSQRDEVTIKLVMLAAEYRGGVRYDRVGDAATGYADYVKDREQLLATLSPRRGLFMA